VAAITDECLDPRVILQANVTEDISCLAADYQCGDDSVGFCTKEEKLNNDTIRVYTYVEDCDIYLNETEFSNVICCNETLCNPPEREYCAIKKCYNGSFAVKPGCVDPKLLDESEVVGNDMSCISYSFVCSNSSADCTEEERSNMTMKTILTYGNQSHCNALKSGGGFSNVTCCNNNQCNAPVMGICESIECITGVTKYLDDGTGCVDKSSVISDKFKYGDYYCLSYRFTCSVFENNSHCSQEENIKNVEKVAFAAVSPSECEQYENNWNYRNVTCCGENLCNADDVACFGKQCYGGVTIEDTSTHCIDTVGIYHMRQNETYKCISYKYKCLLNDSACTEKEIKEGLYKWRFSISTPDFCVLLLRNPMAANVSCCEDSLCNVPTGGLCPIREEIECYDGILNPGKDNCINSSLLTSTKLQNSSLQCISYLHKCTQGDNFCNSSEIDTGSKKWIFTAGTEYECSQLRGPLNATYLTCCGTNKCNNPWFPTCKGGTEITRTSSTTRTVTSTRTTAGTKGGSSTTGDGVVNYLSIILLLITYLILKMGKFYKF